MKFKFKFFILLFTIIMVMYTGCVKESPKETPEQRVPSYEETKNFFTPREIITENETRKYISTVWEKIKDTEETKFVISEKSYSAIVFIHPYSVGAFDPKTAEWIIIISSIPEREKNVKIAIFRSDYETYNLKKAYNFSYLVNKEFTLEESVVIMKEKINETTFWEKRSWIDNEIDKESIALLGGNYIYIRPAVDFGGTMIVNKYAGKVIYFATTIWDGRGSLVFPEKIE